MEGGAAAPPFPSSLLSSLTKMRSFTNPAPFVPLLLLAAASACGREEAVPSVGGRVPGPLVLVVVDSLAPASSLPWCLERVSHIPLACARLAEDSSVPPFDIAASLAEEAAREQLLIAMIDQPLPPSSSGRDCFSITTSASPSGSRRPGAQPADILEDISSYDWESGVDRNRAAVAVLAKYLPDLMVIRLSEDDPESVTVISGIWFAAAESLRCSVAVISPPRAGSRGWVALAGLGVRTCHPEGLTPGGLVATLELLAGLDWEPSMPAGVPALEALDFDPLATLGTR